MYTHKLLNPAFWVTLLQYLTWTTWGWIWLWKPKKFFWTDLHSKILMMIRNWCVFCWMTKKKNRQTNKQLKTNQTKTNKNNQNKNQGHIYMVKVSTTVFKVLVFETATLFLIFSDYGHICSWNYTLQLHTTACAVTGGWCSSSDVFFQLPCWPCVHNNANIPRQKVHHVYSCEFFFNLLVTKFPTVTVVRALQNFWNNQLRRTLDANCQWLSHIPLEWEMNFHTRFT